MANKLELYFRIMKEPTIDLIALSKGNTQAFDCVFLLYYPKVKIFIYSLLDNEEEAEDLAQDTFIKLWTARTQLSQVQNINAYIYQTAKHVLYTFLDKKTNTHTVGIDSVQDTPSLEQVEEIVYSHELESLINRAIDNMPPQRKQIFCMSRKQGISNEEISQRLNISKRTVETHISIALATLRKVTSALMLF